MWVFLIWFEIFMLASWGGNYSTSYIIVILINLSICVVMSDIVQITRYLLNGFKYSGR